jgi:4-amino-4-deoxy-L-arabinose transferase-like glycosyltransferase
MQSIPLARKVQPGLLAVESEKTLITLVFLGLLLLGIGLRLLDLKDEPLDIAPLRQLNGAVAARGMYYQMNTGADPTLRQKAIDLWQAEELYEPRLLERMVAFGYLLLGSEQLWVVRLYDALFWVVGAIFLFKLARRITSPGAALASLGAFAVIPLGVLAGRTFQPEPLMIMMIIVAAYGFYRWSEAHDLRWALLSGILGGLAILVKVVAAFPVLSILAALLLYEWGWKRALHDFQVWLVGIIIALVPALYYIFQIGGRSSGYFSFWTVGFASMLFKPSFYLAWLDNLHNLYGLSLILFGLIGMFLLPGRGRALAAGWWFGHFLYGCFFPYQITTHDYYNFPLVPVISLSFAGLAFVLLPHLGRLSFSWKLAGWGIALMMLAYPAWTVRLKLAENQYNGEAAAWREVGQELPQNAHITGLVHDYGARLAYYGWFRVSTWPYRADFNVHTLSGGNQGSFQEVFDEYTRGQDYFLVTLFSELDAQPELKAMLYDHYAIAQEAGAYVLFDLHQRH